MVPTLDEIDASWTDGEPSESDALDALEEGWDQPRRFRTAAEKAVARKEKARIQAERKQARSAAAAQRQKKKQPKKPRQRVRSDGSAYQANAGDETPEAIAARPQGWLRMFVAIAIIITVATIAMFVVRR